MTVLAKAVKGKEFLYDAKSAHEVSKASADVICDTLNATKFLLKEGEVWHKFDFGPYSEGWAFAMVQKFTRYKTSIRETRKWGAPPRVQFGILSPEFAILNVRGNNYGKDKEIKTVGLCTL